MTKKKAIDITTAGWSQDDIRKLTAAVHKQKMTLKAKIELPDGKIKYMYGRSEVELEMYARMLNAKILETGKFE